MKLLQLIPLYDSYYVFLRELAHALEEEGHEVLTVCNTSPQVNTTLQPKHSVAALKYSPKAYSALPADFISGNLRHLEFPRSANLVRHMITAFRLRRIMKEFKPDVVHAHFSAAALTAALARRRNRILPRWLATFQGLQFPYSTGVKGQLIRRAECFSASRMDKVWVLSADDEEALRKNALAASVYKQQAFGFGCDDRFVDTPLLSAEEKTSLRQQVGLSADHRVFIFIGRMVAFKGFHLAARAFMQCAEVHPEYRWIVIGEPDPIHPTGLTDSEWAAFQAHPSILWAGTQQDVLPWIEISDAMLFPSSREGMPVSVMESLARRVPVLTNKVRGCRDLIQEGKNGHFFESASVESIRQILNDFRPFAVMPSADHLRRSVWIDEMKQNYEVLRVGRHK